jgi:hypothetical protein
MELTVACAYKPGNGFTDEYVTRLRDDVQRFCKAPHRFVCLTNERFSDIETIKPRGNNRSWWMKLHLFSEFKDPTVYFDLDTILVDDVTDICTYPHVFTGLTGFKTGKFASGFMAWNGDYSYLDVDADRTIERNYDAFVSRDWERHGEQSYVAERLRITPQLTGDMWPGRFVSYKYGVRRRGFVPKGASVVCFHGKPRPADVNWSLPNG